MKNETSPSLFSLPSSTSQSSADQQRSGWCFEQAQVKGIGIDIAPISRIATLISRYDQETLSLLFTPNEIEQCQSASHPHRHYAVCFSTKEAVGKALGTGLVDISWNEVEANVTDIRLTISLSGEANRQASLLGVHKWLATWCHWDDYVLVHVLAQ